MVYVLRMANVWSRRNPGRQSALVPERHSARGSRAVVGMLVAACLGASLWPSVAWACRCAQPPAPAVALEGAEAVFIGRVVGVRRHSDRERAIDLVVERVFKGTLDKSVTVLTPMSSAACGRRFEADVSYLVYAGRLGDALHDNLCSRTTPLEHAGDDIAALSGLSLEPRDPSEALEEHRPPQEDARGSTSPTRQLETAPPQGGETDAPMAHDVMPTGHDAAPVLDERPAQLVAATPRLDDGQRSATAEQATPSPPPTTITAPPAAPLAPVASPEGMQSSGCAHIDATSAPHLVGLWLALIGCRRRGRGARFRT